MIQYDYLFASLLIILVRGCFFDKAFAEGIVANESTSEYFTIQIILKVKDARTKSDDMMTSFGTDADIIRSRRRYYENRATFWKLMCWAVPIFITVSLGFYIFMLTSITKPTGRLQAEDEHLRQENAKLNKKTDRLQQELSDISQLMAKMNADIEHTRRDIQDGKRRVEDIGRMYVEVKLKNEELSQKVEKSQEQMITEGKKPGTMSDITK